MHATKKDRTLTQTLIATGIAVAMGSSAFGQESDAGGSVFGKGSDVEFHGYLRAYAGWTTERTIEIDKGSGALSMLRGQAYLEAQSKNSALQWKVSARMARENKTSFLNDLQKQTRTVASPYANPNFDVMDIYNDTQIRDAWVQVQPTENLNIKFGRQQVVWGETDLFQALDVIHGHNLTWSPLLEEPDETRKPLILLNTVLTVPEANGSLQLILRPGWDAKRDNGSTWDIYGGRARTIGFKGASSKLTTDYEHPEGDLENKLTYALRWKGLAGGVNYHLSYVNMPYVRNPIANSVFAPYKKAPIDGLVANWIVPIVQVYGAGLNAYVQAIDTVLAAEVVNTRDEPFNVGNGVDGPVAIACGAGGAPFLSSFSGLCGVKRKSTVMTMLRAEKSLKTNDILGTSSPMTAALQIFNTRIMDFKRREELVQSVGYPNLADESSTFVSLVLRAPFMQDKLTPTIALGRDITNHGSLFAIAVDYELGTNWRLRAELDTYQGNSTVKMQNTPVGYVAVGSASGLPGLLEDTSKFVLRATYQF
jgi:hypothetical protein